MAKASPKPGRRDVPSPAPAPTPAADNDTAVDGRIKYGDKRAQAKKFAEESNGSLSIRQLAEKLGMDRKAEQNIRNWAKSDGFPIYAERARSGDKPAPVMKYGTGSQLSSGSALDQMKRLRAQMASLRDGLEREKESLLKRIEEIDAELSSI